MRQPAVPSISPRASDRGRIVIRRASGGDILPRGRGGIAAGSSISPFAAEGASRRAAAPVAAGAADRSRVVGGISAGCIGTDACPVSAVRPSAVGAIGAAAPTSLSTTASAGTTLAENHRRHNNPQAQRRDVTHHKLFPFDIAH